MLYETELQDADTPNEMRVALNNFGCSDPLTRRVYDLARVAGFGGEDTYTLLAYAAITDLIRVRGMYMHYINTNPKGRIVPDPDNQPGD